MFLEKFLSIRPSRYLLGALGAFGGRAFGAPAAETIRVAIGTQDTTINCATGGPIVRELQLLEKYLPHDGQATSDVKYDIQWENQPTGAQLNSKYLANQLDIVQMADFPSVLGATALKAAGDKVQSFYIATLSGGINGAGNAIVVPAESKVQSLAELKGKKISVPFGSTAHAMLIRALQDLGWDPEQGRRDRDADAGGRAAARSRPSRSTLTPTSCRSASCFRSAASPRRSTTAARRASPRRTACRCARTTPRSIRRSSSPT